MNKNYLILFIIILAIILYNCKSSKENMEDVQPGVIQGNIFLKGDKVNQVFDLKNNDMPDSETDEEEIIDNIDTNDRCVVDDSEKNLDVLWEGKYLSSNKILQILQNQLSNCGISKLKLTNDDIVGLTNRKKFIQLLPILRDNIRSLVNYDQIRCFVTRYDPDNYINIAKIQERIPRFLPHKNMIMINNLLYQFTPYGVIKYQLPELDYIDSKDSLVTASMEATLVNDINRYNDSTRPIIPLKGRIYQIKSQHFYDIKNGEKVDIIKMMKELYKQHHLDMNTKKYIEHEEETENVEEQMVEEQMVEEQMVEEQMVEENIKEENMEKENITEEENLPEEFFRRILFAINHEKQIYVVKARSVLPNDHYGLKINEMIKSNDLIIRGVIPHFFHGSDNRFHIEYLFLTNSNYYFIFKDGKVSKLLDFKKVYGFSFTKTLKYKLSCQEHRTILDQLVKTNEIPISRKNKILSRLKCIKN